MNLCYLSIGSNQKHPKRQIALAIDALKRLKKSQFYRMSSIHITKAWGLSAQQDFHNCAVALYTRLTPTQLLRECQAIELSQGRVRKKKWGPRTLDIDIIFYGSRRIKTKTLIIPHPYFEERDFVLIPLLEIQYS
jgi:2-amino-4-hydroxy-6-hydroxymethyldihydropteridine diphosphokinase